jgi:hypothetical protein
VKLPSRIWSLIVNLFGELSDEAAYARYLRHHGKAACAAEWRAFSNQRYRRKYQNAKCC